METRTVRPAEEPASAPVGSPRARVSTAIADPGNETRIRLDLAQLRLRGERNFSRYAPECWEEPLSSKEKQRFGKPLNVFCWCSESKTRPHTSAHYR